MADKTLKCKDCGADFIFTDNEQAFYKEKGFDNEPQRCASCRKAKKEQRNEGGFGGGSGGGNRSFGGSSGGANKSFGGGGNKSSGGGNKSFGKKKY